MKKNTQLRLSTTVALLVLLFGCAKHFAKGKPIDPQKNQLLQLESDKANKGKRFSVTGYAAFGNDIKVGPTDDPVIDIYSEPDGKGRLLVSFPIHYGKGANKVHVPEEFTNADIVLYDDNGKTHPYNQKMQFSFTLDLQLDRQRIEKYLLDDKGIPDIHKKVLVFPAYLTNIRVDPAE